MVNAQQGRTFFSNQDYGLKVNGWCHLHFINAHSTSLGDAWEPCHNCACVSLLCNRWPMELQFRIQTPCTLVLCLKSNECRFAEKRRLSLQLKKPSMFSFKMCRRHRKCLYQKTPIELPSGPSMFSRLGSHTEMKFFPEEQCPDDILLSDDADTLSY